MSGSFSSDAWAEPSPFVSVLAILPELEEGDLVEIHRGTFFHWAVYVGKVSEHKHYVIHLNSVYEASSQASSFFLNSSASMSSSMSSNKTDDGKVSCEDILEVVRGDKCRINNFFDKHREPLDKKEIVKRARSKLNKMHNYHLVFDNCEHFANWCRYDVKISTQAVGAVATGGILAAAVVGAMAVAKVLFRL